MKFGIYTMIDNGSGMKYSTKEEFLSELSRMIDDCEANGGTHFDVEVLTNKSCFLDEETLADLFGRHVDELACHSNKRKNVNTNE